MSSMHPLDGAAGFLATVDPVLAGLPAVVRRFENSAAGKLHDVSWAPGQHCTLCYRVRRPGRPSTFVAVRLDSDGWSEHTLATDGGLPGARAVSDCDTVRELVQTVLDEPVLDCRIEPVRYRPGSRCVLRYDVRTGTGARTLYAKVLAPASFSVRTPSALALAQSAFGRLVPTVEAVWPRLQTVVTSAAPGRSASSVLGDPALPPSHRARLAHRVGGLLADLHATEGVCVPPWTAADQVAAVARSLEAMASVDTALAERVAGTLDRLRRSPARPRTRVLTHGGFRAGQVVVGSDDELRVLDLDGLALGDPCRDLGTVLGHLLWQRLRRPREQLTLRAAEEALLAGYEKHAGPVAATALAWWRAAGLLQVAVRRYSRLEAVAWPLVPGLLDAAEAMATALDAPTVAAPATDLLDRDGMSRVLGPALGGAAAPRRLEVTSAEVIARAGADRVLLRYQVRDPAGQGTVLVGKAFREARRAALLDEHLRLLHDGPFAQGGLRVPEPVCLVPELRLVLYRFCSGEPLDRIADGASAEKGVRSAARWLARLHTADLTLPRAWSLAGETQNTKGWAAWIGRAHPHLAGAARTLASDWAQATRAVAPSVSVPIHKDFHAGHVLVGETVSVLDLDEARQGDPALDLAHFCTYLQATRGRLLTRHDDSAALRAAFLQEYTDATGWNDKGSFDPFRAYTWLKIAKQCALGSGPFASFAPAERSGMAADALREGAQCLSA